MFCGRGSEREELFRVKEKLFGRGWIGKAVQANRRSDLVGVESGVVYDKLEILGVRA